MPFPLPRSARVLSATALAMLVLGAPAGCNTSPPEPGPPAGPAKASAAPAPSSPEDAEAPQGQPPARKPRDFRVAHVFVALCDNAHQGIVKVPAALGNGQAPDANLYWGAKYGVRTFLSGSKDWTPLKVLAAPKNGAVLDRCALRSAAAGPAVYVVAEAYDGARMTAALADFLSAAAGLSSVDVEVPEGSGRRLLEAGGRSDLVAFVGHNGLMDVRLDAYPRPGAGPRPGGAVVLACKSRDYFLEPLRQAGCVPLLTTSQFMAPEAYTLDAILRGWAAGGTPAEIRRQAGAAYAKYQKCGRQAAERIFVAGVPADERPAGRTPGPVRPAG